MCDFRYNRGILNTARRRRTGFYVVVLKLQNLILKCELNFHAK